MSTERVLVVDDNLQNRLVAEGYLAAAGYEVETVEGGAQALAVIEADPPALVLLDILMPHMDGFETCRRIRALPNGSTIPVVFLTALSDLGSYRQALDAGADDYLPKPIRQTELLLRVRSLLRIRQLHRKIEERNAMLVHEQEQRKRLTALLVHDLKSPLAAQLLNCEFLQALDLEADAREAIDDIAAATSWMQRMVLEMLDIHRSEAASMRITPATLGARELIEDAFAALSRLAVDAGQRLELLVEPDDLRLVGDRDLLHRVMLNLFDNCQKYAPRDSVVKVHVRREDAGVVVEVADRGPGIPEAQREVVFSLYGRLESDQRRPSRGLGLAFCRMAVEAHGGSIEVRDQEGGGSLFRIALPQDDAAT